VLSLPCYAYVGQSLSIGVVGLSRPPMMWPMPRRLRQHIVGVLIQLESETPTSRTPSPATSPSPASYDHAARPASGKLGQIERGNASATGCGGLNRLACRHLAQVHRADRPNRQRVSIMPEPDRLRTQQVATTHGGSK
jgi:hypothetical protein